MVGDAAREQIEESIAKIDPFNRERDMQYTFNDKSKGGPFMDLSVTDLDRFILRKKKEYETKYR